VITSKSHTKQLYAVEVIDGKYRAALVFVLDETETHTLASFFITH
jgi:hypothetical protein